MVAGADHATRSAQPSRAPVRAEGSRSTAHHGGWPIRELGGRQRVGALDFTITDCMLGPPCLAFCTGRRWFVGVGWRRIDERTQHQLGGCATGRHASAPGRRGAGIATNAAGVPTPSMSPVCRGGHDALVRPPSSVRTSTAVHVLATSSRASRHTARSRTSEPSLARRPATHRLGGGRCRMPFVYELERMNAQHGA